MTPRLREQRRLQLRCLRRDAAWISWLPPLGFVLSALGLLAGRWVQHTRFERSMLRGGAVLFGFILADWVTWPLRVRSRIVPYFSRQVGAAGGDAAAAFSRGHGLHREAAVLDRLAARLGVTPLSAFGFEDERCGQQVRWHAAADLLESVAALRARAGPELGAETREDLETLARVLQIASGSGVEVSLLLRLGGDAGQALMYEVSVRQGSFW